MFPGFNTNVQYRDKTYHIQTEDSGTKNPVIITLLYSQGAVLAAKKTDYSELVGSEGWKEKVLELMKGQHQDMISNLTAGRCTAGVEQAAPASERDGSKRSIDDVFLDYIIGTGRGTA